MEETDQDTLDKAWLIMGMLVVLAFAIYFKVKYTEEQEDHIKTLTEYNERMDDYIDTQVRFNDMLSDYKKTLIELKNCKEWH